jgi:hypothetical protein
VVKRNAGGGFDSPVAQRLSGSAFQDFAAADFGGDPAPDLAYFFSADSKNR